MPIHPFQPPSGKLVHLTIESRALADNLLGDPSARSVAVYLPAGYEHSDADYPVFVDLVGFTGSGLTHVGWKAFCESVPQRIDRLVATDKMGPVIAVFPDCFTSLGGNQYINSLAIGRWEDFLIDDILPRIEAEFRARRGPNHRAVFGKSSGGYGALVHGLRHGGEVWGALACHSGDMAFDWCYRSDLPKALDMLVKHNGIGGFIEHIEGAPKLGQDELYVLMLLAMAATYDPDVLAPKGIRLPVDPHTCELIDERWEAWLAHDPCVLVDRPEHRERLGALRGLFIDCGRKDQYMLHYGARTFARKLTAYGIAHRYEEFDDNHSSVDYRMDVSLPYLYEALAG